MAFLSAAPFYATYMCVCVSEWVWAKEWRAHAKHDNHSYHQALMTDN